LKDDSKSRVLGATAGDAGNLRMRVVDWQRQTIDELRQATPIQEQMIVTILATAWRPEAQVWDEAILTTLLKSFARDVNTATEHKVEIAMRSIESGAAVLEAFASAHIIGLLTNEALRVAISKRQLDEFFRCWLSRPLVAGDLVPFEQTFMSKLLRLVVTGLVVSNVFVFIMLFIIPEFQKMYAVRLTIPHDMGRPNRQVVVHSVFLTARARFLFHSRFKLC
jgi:hypothetical protein